MQNTSSEAYVLRAPRVYGAVTGDLFQDQIVQSVPETLKGSTPHFMVYYSNNLGASGPSLADFLLSTCERDYSQLQAFFTSDVVPRGLPFIIHIIPGRIGAYWIPKGNPAEMWCTAFDGNDGDLLRMLMIAEASEMLMVAQNRGWNPGFSNGEALSRVLAATISGRNFATGDAWLNSERQNFFGQNDLTDGNSVSTGCAVLFLNYLRNQFGVGLDQIVQTGGNTLYDLYLAIGGEQLAANQYGIGNQFGFEQFARVSASFS